MARSVEEWIANSDDDAIPPRIKDAIARKADDCCQRCARKVGGKLRAEIDHVIPLIIGGKHRQSNLQILCHECHGAKTALDVKLKSRIAKSRKKRMGFVRKGPKMQGRSFDPRPPQNSTRAPNKFCAWRGYVRSDA
jgi:5-methylcytosine-specific restriction protein A